MPILLQIEVDPKYIPKNALYGREWPLRKCPNSIWTFQRVMDNIRLGIQNERCLVDLDNIIVYSSTTHEHLARLTEVFKRLRSMNLKIQPKKYEFLPFESRSILNFTQPKNLKEIKSDLTSTPILIFTNFDHSFLLTTDTSGFAIGTVLSQSPIGQDLQIVYASRTLCHTETRYSTIDRELLAIMLAVKNFRLYFLDRKFKLITNLRSLTWLFSIKDLRSRLARWRLKLKEFDYDFTYKPRKIYKNADALSRN